MEFVSIIFYFASLISFSTSFSTPGDVVGKISVGYQGWFSAIGDGSPGLGRDGKLEPAWWHWSAWWFAPPSESNRPTFPTWPDMRDYTNKYKTDYPNLGNGQPATLFSSFDTQTIDVHFQQMQQNQIDSVALQRSYPDNVEGPMRDAITQKVIKAAEKYNRKLYLMYCLGGYKNVGEEMRSDWLNKMSYLAKSPAYARQNGKPVIAIWGCGFTTLDDATPEACLGIINWFKNTVGAYVIGGVPATWKKPEWGGTRAGFYPNVFKAYNMISPWIIGRVNSIEQADSNISWQTEDLQYCKDNGMDYQPNVCPGSLATRERKHGDFMWRQFYNMKKLGAQGLYITMFDEYQEANQIAKTAETKDMIPKGSNFSTLDEDGTYCTADYYLRLTRDGGKMFRGEIPLNAVRPTIPGKSI